MELGLNASDILKVWRSGLLLRNSSCYHGVGRMTYVCRKGGTRFRSRVFRNAFRTWYRHTWAVVKWIIQRVIGIIPRVFVTTATTNVQWCLVCVYDKHFENVINISQENKIEFMNVKFEALVDDIHANSVNWFSDFLFSPRVILR